MKVTKIINVNLAVNYSLDYNHYRNTSIQFMMDIKITNVNLVVNHFLQHKSYGITSTQFMKVTKITNVNLAVNHFLKHQIWRNTSNFNIKQVEKHEDFYNNPASCSYMHEVREWMCKKGDIVIHRAKARSLSFLFALNQEKVIEPEHIYDCCKKHWKQCIFPDIPLQISTCHLPTIFSFVFLSSSSSHNSTFTFIHYSYFWNLYRIKNYLLST